MKVAVDYELLQYLHIYCQDDTKVIRQIAVPILCELITHFDSSLFIELQFFDILVNLLQDLCWRTSVFETIIAWF
jgi:hypothetical protein